MTERLMDILGGRVLLLDGAMGTTLHGWDLDVQADYQGCENCPEVLNLSRPDVIEQVHRQFLEAGCEAVQTNSFGAMAHVLEEFGLGGRSREICRVSAEIARRACRRAEQATGRRRFVFGSLGPGTKLLTLGQIDWPTMLASYTEAAVGLLEGGVDALMIETCQDLLQCKCAVNGCIAAQEQLGRWGGEGEVPIFVQVTMETSGTMLLGTEMEAVVAAVGSLPVAGLGLNCATGPVEMAEHVRCLWRSWPGYISVQPNAGLPELVDGRTVFPLGPDEFAGALGRLVGQYGVNLVGGCCGTTPAHLRALAEQLGRREPARRPAVQRPAACSSLYSTVELRQPAGVLVIGERTNANGSRQFRRLLEAEDWEGIVAMGRQEARQGAQVLDVCVDCVGRDGVLDMAEVVGRLARQVTVPLMLDSTEAAVIEAGLQRAPGKCIVNSIHLEDGGAKLERICRLVKRYGAAVVALTIDEDPEQGMAKTAQRKLAIAERLHRLCVERWGLDEQDILFDVLTFTVATGNPSDRRLGLETLEAVEQLARRLPRCGRVLGISNISFGLKPAARQVLNSVFLHEAVQRGLTAAIVHPSKILPQTKIPAEQWEAARWLLYDRRGADRPEGMGRDFDPLHHFIGLFEQAGQAGAGGPASGKSLSLEERLQRRIIDGEAQGLEADLEKALQKYDALSIINDHLLAGMKQVGDLFGSGRMQLPFVLQSAEVMKRAVAYLEPHMDKAQAGRRGRIVLATVQGDVHDIGKNLVDIILTNNGYEVVNLGIKQPLSSILSACREQQADAVGMSGLLVKSVAVMRENLEQMVDQGWRVPVLVGGAALNRHYAQTALRSAYGDGPVYYGRDAFEALEIMEALMTGRGEQLEQKVRGQLARRAQAEQVVARSEALRPGRSGRAAGRGRTVEAVEPPRAPFYGARVVEQVPVDAIRPYLNKVSLFRGQWGFRKAGRSEQEYRRQLAEQVEPMLEQLWQQCKQEQVFRPAVVYGYWPCQSRQQQLLVYDPQEPGRVLQRFVFPRQKGRRRLCISDYFQSVDSGVMDVVGFSCVTVGPEVSRRAAQLFGQDQYLQYLYLHGLGVELAEALAEMWHARMRREMGIDADDAPQMRRLIAGHYRGCRYSFGYPACPDLADQAKLFALLEPQRIGCRLTENYQIEPEQSTSAVIVHHPQACYFNV